MKYIFKIIELFIRLFDPKRDWLADFDQSIDYSTNRGLCNIIVFIPFRDKWDHTEIILNQMIELKKKGEIKEVVLIDNQSVEEKTLLSLKNLPDIRVVNADFPFNFSKLINFGVASSDLKNEDQILIVNNDLKINCLDDFINFRKFVSSYPNDVTGATLLYPDRRVQHLFAQPGVKIVAAHPYKGEVLDKNHPWFLSPKKVPAVTGAFMIFSKETFDRIGGFDETLSSVGQDIDFCMSAQDHGRACYVFSPLKITHEEGVSRGSEIDFDEVSLIYKKWGDKLAKHPLFFKDQSRWSEKVIKSRGEGVYPWWML